MFLGMQDFDFAQISPKFVQILPKFHPNLSKFCPKNFLRNALHPQLLRHCVANIIALMFL